MQTSVDVDSMSAPEGQADALCSLRARRLMTQSGRTATTT